DEVTLGGTEGDASARDRGGGGGGVDDPIDAQAAGEQRRLRLSHHHEIRIIADLAGGLVEVSEQPVVGGDGDAAPNRGCAAGADVVVPVEASAALLDRARVA